MDDKELPQSNSRARRSSLSRRSRCVKKKAAELAVLCGAPLCLIHFDQDGQLSTFPEDASEVGDVLKRYLRAGGDVPEKRKVSGTRAFQGGGGGGAGDVVPGEGSGTDPAVMGDELLDAKSAPELLDLGRALDAKMKQVEERIKLLKGTKSTAPPAGDHKQKNRSIVLRFYRDGTPFSPGDLQLVSCNIPGSSSTETTTSSDQIHDSRCLANSGGDVTSTGDNLICSSGCRRANSCSYCDGPGIFKKVTTNGAGGAPEDTEEEESHRRRKLLGGGGDYYVAVLKKQKAVVPVQLFYRDGTPCCSGDLQMGI